MVLGVAKLICRICGAEYPPTLRNVCDKCLGAVDVIYEEPHENLKNLLSTRTARGVWRYKELLPITREEHIVDIGAGGSPLTRAEELGRRIGIRKLLIKNDTINPSFSFKDRPSSVAVSKAREFNLPAVGCASTGNLASATSAHASAANIPCIVLMPDTVELPKIRQASMYGSHIILVDGTYDDTNRLAYLLTERARIGIVNVNLRPYYVEGSKTMMFEIVEQLGWRAPENIIIPMASGALLGALHKALRELEGFNVLDDINTAFHGVQPVGCAPISDAYARNAEEVTPVRTPNTIVKSLAIGSPGDGEYALGIVRKTGGTCQAISDKDVIEAVHLLCQTTGIYAEPGGAITIAAAKKMREEGILDEGDEVVCCVTGAGYKADEFIEPRGKTYAVKPKISEVLQTLSAELPILASA